MVNIALSIAGSERKENPEAYLQALQKIKDMYGDQIGEVFHSMVFTEEDVFGKGFIKEFPNARCFYDEGNKEWYREVMVKESAEKICEVLIIGPNTPGIQKETELYIDNGYEETWEELWNLNVPITRLVLNEAA